MDSNYTISVKKSLIDVLKKLESLTTTQTVFIIDDDRKVLGSITDGDIRRGLINGFTLDCAIDKFAFKEFKYIVEGENNFSEIKEFRKLRLKAVPLLNPQGQLINVYDFSKTRSILPIDAVIMAGGKGKRLKPYTETTPKPLLKVGNKEIISYNFDRLLQFGVINQHVTVNYLGEQLVDFCKDYNSDINFNMVQEGNFLGTAGSLSLIDEFHNDVILLMNSDLLTNIDYEDLYKTFIEKDADMMVASIPYNVDLPYAILDTENRHVKSFKEKPSYTYYANAGIYLIKKELLTLIPKNTVYNATDLMEDVIAKGNNLLHYPIRSYWLDIGKHEDFEKAQKDIAHIDFD